MPIDIHNDIKPGEKFYIPANYGFWYLDHFGWGGHFGRRNRIQGVVVVDIVRRHNDGSPMWIKVRTSDNEILGVECY